MASSNLLPSIELELSSDVQGWLPHVQLERAPVLSCGSLLEWGLAVQHIHHRPLRLVYVSWFPRLFDLTVRVRYREHSDGVVVLTGPAAGKGGAAPCLLASTAGTPAWRQLPPEGPRSRRGHGSGRLAQQEFYAALEAATLRVAVQDRVVIDAELARDRASARIRPSPCLLSAQFLVGPHALDSALQLASLCATRELGLPVAPAVEVARVELLRPYAAPHGLSLLRVGALAGEHVTYDVAVLDANGHELARLEGIRLGTAAWASRHRHDAITRTLGELVRPCFPAARGDDTDLTALGASSLDLARIGNALEEQLEWRPERADFVANPSIAGLAARYLADCDGTRARTVERASERASWDVLSATEAQLWFLERLTNVAPSYNEALAWELGGSLDVALLEQALRALQQRHPALRSVFPSNQGVPQRKLTAGALVLERRWLAGSSGGYVSDEQLRAQLEALIRRPFELETTPAFRCTWIGAAGRNPVLLLCAHHILCDAWSLAQLIVPQLGEAYAALLRGERLDTTERPPSQRAPSPEQQSRAADHFARKLDGMAPLLDFPFDHVRPARQTHRGALLRRTIDPALWQALKATARQLQLSPFVVTLALYELLLHRYTRQEAFCIGVPVSMRRTAQDDHAVACLVSLSVLCARVELEQSFLEHAQRVKAELVDLLEHDAPSLGEIVRAASARTSARRSLSHTPLVQAVFGFRELPGSDLKLDGASVAAVPVHNGAAKFDLALALDDRGGHAELSLEYASDLLEPSSAERLLGQFEQLLAALVADPGARVRSLSLSNAAEQARILVAERGPAEHIEPLHYGLGLLSGRASGAVALTCGDQAWSVERLAAAVRAITARLELERVGPGQFVALCIPRGPEWVAAVLAVLGLGAAYAPFDQVNPHARIRHGIRCCGAKLVITLAGAYVPDAQDDLTVIELAALTMPAAAAPVLPAQGSDPARAIYGIMTSGSTGLPKVAAVHAAGFDNLVGWYVRLLELGARDRVLVVTSIGFDLTQKNVFAALVTGAQLVIDPEPVPDPARLCELIEARGVTVLNCTPSLAYRLVASAATRGMHELRSLRRLVLGGEPIDPSALAPWTSHPSCTGKVINSYGPTECTDVVAATYVAGDDASPSIGAPIPNLRCRVVDVSGAVAGFGVPGELWLSGVALGLGYLADPDGTAARFSDTPEGRWYRSGDLVRRRADGALLFMGRIDTQVKIRGYRVELAEVEAALEALPEVQEAIVIAREDAHGRAFLAGYVCTHVQPRADLARWLRGELAHRLPAYMIPQQFWPIAEVPRTASGKLDRQALPQLEAAEDREDTHVHHGLHARVAQVWCRVLGLRTLALDDDFFEQGGHSLAAIEAVSLLERSLGCPLEVAALFERPTLRDYVLWLDARLSAQRLASRQDKERLTRGVA